MGMTATQAINHLRETVKPHPTALGSIARARGGSCAVITAAAAQRLGLRPLTVPINTHTERAIIESIEATLELGDIEHARIAAKSPHAGGVFVEIWRAPGSRKDSGNSEPPPADVGVASQAAAKRAATVTGSSDDTYPRIGGRRHF